MISAALLVATLLAQAEPPKAADPAALVAIPSPPIMPVPAEQKPIPAPFAPKLTFGGFIDFQYSATDVPFPKPNVSTFEVRRARLGMRGEVAEGFGFNLVFDGADAALKDAYLSLRYLPGVEFRVGQFKTPFGYEQVEADTKLLWVYNSYVVAAMARGRDSRDEGVLANGRWKVAEQVAVEASAALVNGAGPNSKDDLNEKNVWARAGAAVSMAGTTTRLGASYGYGHQVGSTGADGKFGVQGAVLDDTYFYFHTTGVDVTVDSPWLFVAAEWIQSRRHVTRYTAPTTSTTTDIIPQGWYVGAYGKTSWNLGPIFRAERAHLPTSSGTAVNAGWNERYTVGAYYDVIPVNARFVLNYEFDESAKPLRTGNRLILFAQVIF
jgi:hypothetical protein